MLTSNEKIWCWVTWERNRLQDRWWCWKKEKKGQGVRMGDISPIVLGTWRMCRGQFMEFTSNETQFELIDPTLFSWLTRAFVERLTACAVAREQSWVTMEQTSNTRGKIAHYTGKKRLFHTDMNEDIIIQTQLFFSSYTAFFQYFLKEIEKKKYWKKNVKKFKQE